MKINFSNIIVLNNKHTVEELIEKIKKNLKDLKYTVTSDKNDKQIDFIYIKNSSFVVICSKYYEFKDLSSNKSNIRKIAKNTAQDVFMISSLEDNIAVLEKYSFNKRIYDYIVLGNKEILRKLEYGNFGRYTEQIIWNNSFVGKNTISNLDKILDEKDTYFRNDEILIDILKLYGINEQMSSYNLNDNITNNELIKETIYFK